MHIPKVSIGMPVYNGERFISFALESLCQQRYRDWRLLISDNCSSDGTQEICERFVRYDHRITYVRQSRNHGAGNNFKLVLDNANSEYFMWAAADDMWDTEFLNSCVESLEVDKQIGLAFTGVVAIDSFGRIVRGCPTLPSLSGHAGYKTICRYLLDPEINGKANLIYGLYRLEICRAAWIASNPSGSTWGADMCFVLAALARSGAIIDRRILFKKRYVRDDDRSDTVNSIRVKWWSKCHLPKKEFPSYFKDSLKAVRGTRFFFLTFFVMTIRGILFSR